MPVFTLVFLKIYGSYLKMVTYYEQNMDVASSLFPMEEEKCVFYIIIIFSLCRFPKGSKLSEQKLHIQACHRKITENN